MKSLEKILTFTLFLSDHTENGSFDFLERVQSILTSQCQNDS